jgi:hypothetical protein
MQEMITKCGKVLAAKGIGYSTGDDDRLGNFKAGVELNTIPGRKSNQKTVLWGYLLKHLTSINVMCRYRTGNQPTREQWDEKIGDAINYLLLLSAMVDEEIREEQEAGKLERTGAKNWTVTRHKGKQEKQFIQACLRVKQTEECTIHIDDIKGTGVECTE